MIALLTTLTLPAAVKGQFREQQYVFERVPKRHALVIGNPEYGILPKLSSSKADGEETARRLRELNFDVVHVPKLSSRRDFEETILPNFRRHVQPGDIVVFYYSGHGFAYGGHTYLAPADLTLILRDRQVDREAVALESVESYLADVSPGILVMLVDACRTVPGFQILNDAGRNTVAKSIAPPSMKPGEVNVLTGYASRAGRPASGYMDSPELSVFTRRLLAAIATPGDEFVSLYKEVILKVRDDTDGDQDPEIYVNSVADLYLNPTPAVEDNERRAWLAALASKQPGTVRHFSRRFSTSRYAAAAREWLDDYEQTSLALKNTLVSPAAVERAWYDPNANVAVSSTGFAFPRSMEQAQALAAAQLSNSELGVLPAGRNNSIADSIRGRWEIATAVALGTVVTTRPLRLFDAPSETTPAVDVAPGTTLLVHEVAGVGAEWLRTSLPGSERSYFLKVTPIGATSAPADIGRPLAEAVIRPAPRAPLELVDSAEVVAALNRARQRGTVYWVSLATAASSDPTEQATATARRAHVEFLLKRAGVDGRQITAVAAAPDLTGTGVRIRFFGY